MVTPFWTSALPPQWEASNPCLADLKGDMYLIARDEAVYLSQADGARAKIRRASLVFLHPETEETVGCLVKQGLSNHVRAHRALTNSAGSCLAGAGLRAGLLRLNVYITFRTSKVIYSPLIYS